MEEITLDHIHRRFKNQPLGEDDAGFCRGVLCRQCNSWEGKVFNAHRRMGLHKKELDQFSLLENLIEYGRDKTLVNQQIVHPTEAPKDKKVKKSCYNKLKKTILKEKGKMVEYPKSKKLTKPLKEAFEKYNIEVEYY